MPSDKSQPLLLFKMTSSLFIIAFLTTLLWGCHAFPTHPILRGALSKRLIEDALQQSISLPYTPEHHWKRQNLYMMHKADSFDVSCSSCSAVLKVLTLFSKFTIDFSRIEKMVVFVCIKFNISPPDVCPGLVKLFGPEILYVLKRTRWPSAAICSTILSENCSSTGIRDNWIVPLPSTPKPLVRPIPSPQPGSPVLKVLHLTDIHLDVGYTVGTPVECNAQLCCHIETKRDKRYPKSSAAGAWGSFGKCDTPFPTLKYMLGTIAARHKLDYIIWTGDAPPHDIWNQTVSSQLGVLKKIDGLLRRYFPNTPVYAAVGNHEASPVDSFPPPDININSDQWLYQALTKFWSRWLPSETSSTVLKGGFYSVLVRPGFRIISLNTNYCDAKNLWLLVNSTDPSDQLHWLVQELAAAEDKSEKVHIIGHIPTGTMDCLPDWSHNYYRIINRFESTVTAQFFGHTHNDEFMVFYDLDSHPRRPSNIAYVAPSVTPYFGNGPAYRVYTIDGNYPNSSWAVLDHESYFMNLTEATKSYAPPWEKLYSAKDAYNFEALNPQNWDQLIQQFKTNSTLFEMYYRFFTRRNSAAKPCGQPCKNALICSMQNGESNNSLLCNL